MMLDVAAVPVDEPFEKDTSRPSNPISELEEAHEENEEMSLLENEDQLAHVRASASQGGLALDHGAEAIAIQKSDPWFWGIHGMRCIKQGQPCPGNDRPPCCFGECKVWHDSN